MNKKLLLEMPASSSPAYVRVAQALREAIERGRLKPREALPSTRTLAHDLALNRLTVLRALDELVAEGWLEARERLGFFVTATLPETFLRVRETRRRAPESQSKPRRTLSPARSPSAMPPYFLPASGKRIEFNFSSGLPELRAFPLREYKSCLWDAFKKAPAILGYGHAAGHPPLRHALAEHLRLARSIVGKEIIVTSGAQEAIFLAAQVLVGPDDVVAVEELGYRPVHEALRASGARLVPVPLDGEGISLEALRRVLERHRPKLLYLTPLHQYPTTVVMPAQKRMHVLELAERHGCFILEDDYDHEFHYGTRPPAPLASHDTFGRVIYVSTYSKLLCPGLRLGLAALPSDLFSPMTHMRHIVTRQSNALEQEAMARFIAEGCLDRHTRRMRRIYEERHACVEELLSSPRARSLGLCHTRSQGGLAVWINTRHDSEAIAQAAAEEGILLPYERQFQAVDSKALASHVRLGFAGHTPRELREGIRRLFRIIESIPGVCS